jgi:hypothetical protein
MNSVIYSTAQEADQRSWLLLYTVQHRRRINDHEFGYIQYSTGGGSTIMNSVIYSTGGGSTIMNSVMYRTVLEADQRSWILLCTEQYWRRINDHEFCYIQYRTVPVQEADQRLWILNSFMYSTVQYSGLQYRRRINDHKFCYEQYSTGGGFLKKMIDLTGQFPGVPASISAPPAAPR